MSLLLVILSVTANFEGYQLVNVGTTGVSMNDVITIIMLFLLFKFSIWDGKELKLAKNPAVPFFYLLLLSTVISGIYPLLSGNSQMITQFLKSFVHFHFTFLIATVFIFYKFENSDWNNFIKLWLILSILINIFGVYQIIARAYDLPFAWLEMTNAAFFSRNQNQVDNLTQLSLRFEGFFRATSIFSEPSALGAFNGITIVFALIPKLKKIDPFLKSNKLNNFIIFLAVIGLLLAFSLTGATIIGIILLKLFLTERLNVVGRVLKVLPIIIILLFVANMIVESYAGISVLELFGKRFSSLSSLIFGNTNSSKAIDGESIITRGANFVSLFNIWLSSPIIGIGLGLTYLSPYADGWAFSDTSIMAAFGELGLIGAFSYILMFITFYYLGFKLSHNKIIIQKIDKNSFRLHLVITYIMSYLVVTNFLSGNNLSGISSVLYFGLIFSVSNNYLIDYEKRYYVLKLVSRPLKERFYKQESLLKEN